MPFFLAARELCVAKATEGTQVPARVRAEAVRLNPEVKLANGDYADVGVTERRHVHAKGAEYIGKEANRREERFLVGDHPETQPTTPAAMPMMTSGPQSTSCRKVWAIQAMMISELPVLKADGALINARSVNR